MREVPGSLMEHLVDVVWDHGYDAETILREVVTRRTGTDPGPLHHYCPTCGAISHGRPSYDAPVAVSVSRAGDLVVVACTGGSPVGIDVSPHDADARSWTRLEAVAKARGTGIVVPHDPDDPEVWLQDLDLAPGFTGTLAVLGLSRPPEVRVARRRRARR